MSEQVIEGSGAMLLPDEPCPVVKAAAMPVHQPLTTMDLIQMATSNGAGIDIIERLVALQERQAEERAKADFNAAMSRAQAQMGRISADATNPQTHSKYATYAAIDKELRPIYTSEGFALSFDTGETGNPETIRVFCHVTHSGGYARTYRVDMPTDGKGAKGNDVMTKTHATGAGMTYGMRYLLKLIFNVAIGENDNDGNVITMPEDRFQHHLKAFKEAVDMEGLMKVYAIAYKEAGKDKPTQAAIIKAYEERKGAIRMASAGGAK